ncbi:MAG: efflux RND transporter permease subunit [Planctomycetes bacterium]|nr:efflux RND transporter permease subunit [Planctomycetota bacterium]
MSGMNAFVRATLRRPVTILMVFCSTVLVGFLATKRIPLELLPRGFVNSNVTIVIPVPNANPIEVEEQVTRPTEEVLRQISGLEKLQTVSAKDNARISITFGKDRNPDEAFAEVRDLMEVAKLSWPDDVREYRTFRFNLDTDLPAMQFGILLDGPFESDTSFLIDEKIIKKVEAIDGVARVSAQGIVEETIRIYVDRDRATAQGVSLFELAQVLGGDNRDIVGGRVREGGRYYYLRSLGRFRDLDELNDYPVRPGLRLGDIAEISSAQALRDFVFRLNGKTAVWFSVNKEAGANTVEVCRRVRAALEERIKTDPRVMEQTWEWFQPEQRDFGRVVEKALEGLVRAAAIGGLLAVLPLFLFLRRVRMTLVITLAIPSSLLITMGALYFGDGTLNLLSMMGITIAIGMLVDNSIVVVENIFRKRQEGLDAGRAALEGTAEVALAVTMATLTTVVAFIPLIFMDANADASFFTKAIGLPVCFSVLASLLVALLFIPLATVVFYREGGRSDDRGLLERALDRLRGRNRDLGLLPALLLAPLLPLHLLAGLAGVLIGMAERLQGRFLGWALDHRLAALALALGSAGLISGLLADRTRMVKSMDESGGWIVINVELDSNYTLADANEVFKRLYGTLEGRWQKDGYTFSWLFFDKDGGTIFAGLENDDPDYTKKVVKELKEALPKIPGVKATASIDRQNEDETSYQVSIYGPEIEELDRIGLDLKDRLSTLPGITRVSGGVAQATEEIVIEPDRERMQFFGIKPRILMGTVQYGIRGQRLPDFHFGDQKMAMIIEFEDAADTTVADLERMSIWDGGTGFQPLANVADVRYAKGYGEIQKSGGRSSIQIKLDTLDGKGPELSRSIAGVLSDYELPEGYSWSESSDADFAEQLTQILGTAYLAMVLILLLMGVLFESVVLPLAVFVTIPFALLGGFWFLTVTNTPVDMMGMIGAIVLIGIVVNNGIVFLDAAHRLAQEGCRRREALVEAGVRRLRPILMTTATTVVGLVPMALAASSGSFISYKSLARAVIGGLTVSTLATLVVVPIVYTLLDDFRRALFDLGGILIGRPRTIERPLAPLPAGAEEPDEVF